MNLLEFRVLDIQGYVLIDNQKENGEEAIEVFLSEDEIIESETFQDYLNAVTSKLQDDQSLKKEIQKVIMKKLKDMGVTAMPCCIKIIDLPEKFFKRLKEKTLLTIEGGLPIPTNDDEI